MVMSSEKSMSCSNHWFTLLLSPNIRRNRGAAPWLSSSVPLRSNTHTDGTTPLLPFSRAHAGVMCPTALAATPLIAALPTPASSLRRIGDDRKLSIMVGLSCSFSCCVTWITQWSSFVGSIFQPFLFTALRTPLSPPKDINWRGSSITQPFFSARNFFPGS